MTINFDKALGIHEEMLVYRSERAKVIANNLANADTPGYKARDLDFQAVLKAARGESIGLKQTHDRHLDSKSSGDGQALLYRTPMQPDTGDGNTVDSQAELARYSQNALEYQTSLHYLSSKFRSLKTAIKGE